MPKPRELLSALRLAHDYADHAGYEEDQFSAFFKDPHDWRRTGIQNTGGVRVLKNKNNGVASLVLYTKNVSSGTHNPWDDLIDLPSGTIRYWGDAKYHEEKKLDDWSGNKRLLEVMEKVAREQWDSIPPILHFSRVGPALVRFNGVCCLRQLNQEYFEDKGKPVRNYVAEMDILAIDRISKDWILQPV